MGNKHLFSIFDGYRKMNMARFNWIIEWTDDTWTHMPNVYAFFYDNSPSFQCKIIVISQLFEHQCKMHHYKTWKIYAGSTLFTFFILNVRVDNYNMEKQTVELPFLLDVTFSICHIIRLERERKIFFFGLQILFRSFFGQLTSNSI